MRLGKRQRGRGEGRQQQQASAQERERAPHLACLHTLICFHDGAIVAESRITAISRNARIIAGSWAVLLAAALAALEKYLMYIGKIALHAFYIYVNVSKASFIRNC